MTKTFNHCDQLISSWKRIHKDGRRYYVSDKDENILLPSITTVLGSVNDTWYENWVSRVGAEEAARVSRIATQTGTQLHLTAENYLSNRNPFTLSPEVRMFVPMIVGRFKKFKNLLDRINNIRAIEKMMGSYKLGIAGTVDCIAEFDGILSIIDFKTSKHIKEEGDIKGYFAQLTAYSLMYEEMTGITIDNLVILMSIEGADDKVFITNRNDNIDYLLECKQNYDKNHKLGLC